MIPVHTCKYIGKDNYGKQQLHNTVSITICECYGNNYFLCY